MKIFYETLTNIGIKVEADNSSAIAAIHSPAALIGFKAYSSKNQVSSSVSSLKILNINSITGFNRFNFTKTYKKESKKIFYLTHIKVLNNLLNQILNLS